MQFALVDRRDLSCKFVSKKSSNCTAYSPCKHLKKNIKSAQSLRNDSGSRLSSYVIMLMLRSITAVSN